MNETLIKKTLELMAEEAVPTDLNGWAKIQPSLSTKSRFDLSKRHSKIQGENQMDPRMARQNRLRLAGIPILITFILLAGLLATPQGRTWAQIALRFFTPIDSLPVLPTPQPAGLVAVTPGTIQPTFTPPSVNIPEFTAQCGDFTNPKCTVDQIREMVNFPIKQLSIIPHGFAFTGATGGSQSISLIYNYDQGDTHPSMFLQIEPWGEKTTKWQIPPSASVETIKIGDNTGEYVKGSWFSDAGPVTIWDPKSDIQTLRWRDGDVLYTLMVFGIHGTPESAIDAVELSNLALSLTDKPIQAPEIQPGVDMHQPTKAIKPIVLTSLDEANQRVGFTVKIPTWLPEGYSFKSINVFAGQNAVCVQFHHSSNIEGVNALHIVESPTQPMPELKDIVDLNDQYTVYQELAIGGAEGLGIYAKGTTKSVDLCDLSSSYREVLLWKAGNLNYILYAENVDAVSVMPSKMQLTRIVESLTGVHTISDDTVDPEHIRSVVEAEKLAGFKLLEPTKLPAGENFSYGTLEVQGTRRTISLYYTYISVSQTSGITQTLEASYPADLTIDEVVTVRGQKAYYRQGCGDSNGIWDKNCWGTMTLIWHEGGVEYFLWGIMSQQMNKEVLIEIAESLR